MVAINEQEFVRILESVLQPNTDAIKNATTTLRKDYYIHPESLLVLINLLKTHPEANLRQLAAVEARTLVPAFWPASDQGDSQIPPNVKSEIRSSLLQSTVNEPEALVKHSSARVISAIAKIDLPQDQWMELPNFLHEAAVSGKAVDREMGVYVLYTLLETLEGKFSDRWADFFQLFSRTIKDAESLQVRMNTLLALGKMAEFLDGDDDADSVRSFRQLLPDMVEVLKQIIATDDDTMADQAFDVFMTLLSADSSLTANHFKDLVQFMMELSTNTELSDDTRQKVMNFLIGCVRLRRLKIQSMKIGETLTLLSLKIAAESADEDPDDDGTLSKTAILLINFLAEGLPPSQVVVPLMHNLEPYVNSHDSNHRRAAITALGACVEGAPDFVATQIQHIVPLVTKLLQDPDLQVRRATLLTLANLADELGAEIGKFHSDIIPLLIAMLDSNDGLEIWKSSCHAIDALLDEVDMKEVQSYLPTLMPRLSQMFTQEDLKLKAAAVGGISSTARGAKETFLPYFEPTMAALSPYLHFKESEEEINLRSVVTDCMGSIAEAIGAQAFTPYVQPLMQSAEESLHLGNSRARETAFYFFSVLARVYKEEFTPFLTTVMPPLFESLEQSETDIDAEEMLSAETKLLINSIGDSEVNIPLAIEDLDAFDEDDDWEELAAVTAVALEKEVAIDSIGEILTHCTQGYLQYLEKTVEILVDKSQHMYEGVRKSAIDTLWRAYAALWQVQGDSMSKWEPGLPLKVEPTKELQHLGAVVINCTLALWKEEEDREVVTAIGHNIGEVLKMCGPAILADKDGAIILEIITQLQLVLTKQHVCQMEAAEEVGLDLGESSEYDWILIESALDTVLGLAAALGPAFGDAWKIVGPAIVKFASSQEHLERSHSIGVIADTIRYMGSGCTAHTPALMKLLLHRLSDEDPETKSNAAYATGLLCEKSEAMDEVTKNYPVILQKLEPLLHTEGSRILDNACGCVARMVMAHENNVPLEQVLGALIDLLPLKEDFEENEPIYCMFVQLYKSQNQVVFGLTPRLLPIFNSVLTAPEQDGVLTDIAREGLVEVIQYIGKNDPAMIQQYPGLASLMG